MYMYNHKQRTCLRLAVMASDKNHHHTDINLPGRAHDINIMTMMEGRTRTICHLERKKSDGTKRIGVYEIFFYKRFEDRRFQKEILSVYKKKINWYVFFFKFGDSVKIH